MQAQRALFTYILNPNAVFRYTERIALNSTFYSKKICFTTGVSYFHYIIRVVLEVSDILGTFHTFLCVPACISGCILHTHTHHSHTSVYSNVQIHICLCIHIQASHTHRISSHKQIHICIPIHRS